VMLNEVCMADDASIFEQSILWGLEVEASRLFNIP